MKKIFDNYNLKSEPVKNISKPYFNVGLFRNKEYDCTMFYSAKTLRQFYQDYLDYQSGKITEPTIKKYKPVEQPMGMFGAF